jgi:uncharacterized protein YndB with AHSA1/START domain
MKTIFTKHEDKKQLHIQREFDASVNLVWRTWTEPELLDQWWAPKPWQSETHHMEFKEGGHRFYSMNGHEGEKHFCRTNYTAINKPEKFEGEDVFCDDKGNVNQELPGSGMLANFIENGGKTTVIVISTFASVEAMEELIKMGVQEGFAMAHNNLDELLQTLQSTAV